MSCSFSILFMEKVHENWFFWQKAASWSKIPKRRPHLQFDFTTRSTSTYSWNHFWSLSMTSVWYGPNWPKLAFIASDGLKNVNFWKNSVGGCQFGHLEWKNGLAIIVNDIWVIWQKLAKIGFYRTGRAQKWKFLKNFCSGVLVCSFGMKKWTNKFYRDFEGQAKIGCSSLCGIMVTLR